MQFCLWPFVVEELGNYLLQNCEYPGGLFTKTAENKKSRDNPFGNGLNAARVITLLFRRSLPCECESRVRPEAQKLFRHRSCQSWPRLRRRRQPSPPCRPRARLPLALWVENRPCTRCHDRFQCDLSGGRIPSLQLRSCLQCPARPGLP